MPSISTSIPNSDKIQSLLSSLQEEFDMQSRLSRYESLAPELIDLATEMGLYDLNQASHALFIADFVITSSEVPPGTTDEERRKSIIRTFIDGLDKRTETASNLTNIYYLAQKLFVAMKRNDSYLAGKGLEADTRKIILIDMYVSPFFEKAQKILGLKPINYELGLLHSMLKQELPHEYIESYLEMDNIDKSKAFPHLWHIVNEFVNSHSADINTDSPLPNVNNTSILYLTKMNSKLAIASTNFSGHTSAKSMELTSSLFDYLANADKKFSLISLRGEIVNQGNHLIMARNPFVNGQPMVMFVSPISDVNTTELINLLELRAGYNEGLNISNQIEGITETTFKQVTKQVEETVEDVVEKEVKTNQKAKTGKIENKTVPKSKKSGGILSRIKSFFFGSKDKKGEEMSKDGKQKSKTETIKETIERTVVRNVTKQIPKTDHYGYQLPEHMAYSLGVYSLEDFRMFEEFDTLRETEYEIIGALESNFEKNETTVLSTSKFEDSEELFNLLDGLDEVIEELSNYYMNDSIQVLPKELLFLSKEGKHFILTLDGNKKGIVATIATTYEDDITNWQTSVKVEKVQRRTLQMRTGQLLSAREHTPFDQATERIYGDALSSDISINQRDRAVLSLN